MLYDHLDVDTFYRFQLIKFSLNQDFEVFTMFYVHLTPFVATPTYLANFNLNSIEILI